MQYNNPENLPAICTGRRSDFKSFSILTFKGVRPIIIPIIYYMS